MIIKDSDLQTIPEIKERINSINCQLDKLDRVRNPRDFNKHHEKYSKLVERKDKLIIILHDLSR